MTIGDSVRVEIAFASLPWATSPSWTAVSNISAAERAKRGVISLDIGMGRGGPVSPWAPSTLTMVCRNRDGDWDGANPAGSVFGTSNLKRNKQIRVTCTDDGWVTSYALFRGWIDDIRPSGTNIDSTATITASDGLRILAEYDLDDVSRSEEWAGDRILNLNILAGVPSGFRGTFQNGTVRMPATVYNTTALSATQQCELADMGFFWWDHDAAAFQYRERWAMDPTVGVTAWHTRQHSFTESGGGGASVIHMSPTWRTLRGFQNVSRVTASSSGGTARTYEYDTTGASEIASTYTKRSHQLEVAYDAMVEYTPRYIHETLDYGDSERVDEIQVRVAPGNTNAVTAITNGYYEPLTRVEVQHTPIGFSSDFNFEAHIESVQHRITPETWDATLTLSPQNTQIRNNLASMYDYGTTLAGTDLGGL